MTHRNVCPLLLLLAGSVLWCEAARAASLEFTPFEPSRCRGAEAMRKKWGENWQWPLKSFPRHQQDGPALTSSYGLVYWPGDPGVWEHRVIGLCSSAPGILPRHGLLFRGGKPGTYKVYLDNLRIRHANGTTTSIWNNGKDTGARKMPDTELFTNVQVRAAPLSATLGK